MNELVSLLPIIGIGLLFWLLIIRPQSRRQKALATLQGGLAPGNEVMLSSGFYGVVDQVEDDHPVRPHVLHLLVCVLVRAERYREAMEALSVVDGYVGALPWAAAPDPAAQYAAYRALAVAGWEAGGGARTHQL